MSETPPTTTDAPSPEPAVGPGPYAPPKAELAQARVLPDLDQKRLQGIANAHRAVRLLGVVTLVSTLAWFGKWFLGTQPPGDSSSLLVNGAPQFVAGVGAILLIQVRRLGRVAIIAGYLGGVVLALAGRPSLSVGAYVLVMSIATTVFVAYVLWNKDARLVFADPKVARATAAEACWEATPAIIIIALGFIGICASLFS